MLVSTIALPVRLVSNRQRLVHVLMAGEFNTQSCQKMNTVINGYSKSNSKDYGR